MTPQEALNLLYSWADYGVCGNGGPADVRRLKEAKQVLSTTITMAQHPDRTQFDARGDTGREGEKK